MSGITKAAQDALAELADWHWSQAATLRKAASTSAMDKPEPVQSSITRMADWHDAQKSLIRAALQDKAGEVADFQSRCMFVARLENMQANGDTWLTIPVVLALLNDCDMLASTELSAHPAPVVPEGFVIVPVEPTAAMIQAGIDEMPHFTDEPGPVWSAMIAASQQKGDSDAS